jgi:hypothetical protein
MNKIAFAVVAFAIVAAFPTLNRPANASTHHSKRNIAVSDRVRNAHAFSAPISNAAPAGPYFDEALSPPAGR